MMIISKKILFFLVSFHLCIIISLQSNVCSNEEYDVSRPDGREYKNSLHTILETLSSQATTPYGFFSSTAGTLNSTAYGLFLCRGDLSPAECKPCVETRAAEVFKFCPNKKRVSIIHELCMVRFSDEAILGKIEPEPPWYNFDPDSYPNGTLKKEVLDNILYEIAIKAANGCGDSKGKKFAVQEAHLQPYNDMSEKIYALAQCTPDLSTLMCHTCLTRGIDNFPQAAYNRKGGRLLSQSCNLRYQPTPFYKDPEGVSGISVTAIVAIFVPINIIGISVVYLAISKNARERREQEVQDEAAGDHVISIPTETDSLRYTYAQVQEYTNNFAIENLIGQDRFDPLYKATLPNGDIVAVKRLSRSSAQEGVEFISGEVANLAKFQHENLVRVLGYCWEREEKILIYEFVSKNSLDHFLFHSDGQSLLDWLTRYKIIGGIARGLSYLHEESRNRIIHGNLRATNVLLARYMDPKIADFWMTRLFKIDHSEGNTSRNPDSRGYMAPEQALRGMLSMKSDVFSFGVLVLEIISGKKNNNMQDFGGDDLLTYAWKQLTNKTPLAVMDPSMENSYDESEVVRCIHIALLCVEKVVERRPTMVSVMLMLTSSSVTLPVPNPPSFHGQRTIERLPREISLVTYSEGSDDLNAALLAH